MRLDKFLADCGLGTRREVKEYIKKGRITVNSSSDVKPEMKLSENDIVCFDGMQRQLDTGFKYYCMNKPAGVVSATEDKREKTVLDLIPSELRKNLSIAGRLDKDTVGLLLLTDDGEFLHRLLSPKTHVFKRYLVHTDLPFNDEDIKAFEAGMDIGDNKPCKSAKLEILSAADVNASIISISEGRFHQIKRMAQKCGKTVTYLKRLSMGNFCLPEDIAEGNFRPLTAKEVECLKGSINSKNTKDVQ